MTVVALKRRADDSPFDRDPERSFTIPARYYLDGEILEQEKEAIFYRNWWYAGHQSQLAESGCYRAVQVCDQNIIVIPRLDPIRRTVGIQGCLEKHI